MMPILGWVALGVVALFALLASIRLRLSAIADETGIAVEASWGALTVRYASSSGTGTVALFGLGIHRSSPNSGPKRASERRPFDWGRLTRLLESRGAMLGIGRYVLRRIHIDRCTAELTIATPDPALTGVLYGWLSALAEPLKYTVPSISLGLRADFEAELPRIRGEIALWLRTGTLVIAGARMVWVAIIGRMKRAWRHRRGGEIHGASGIAQDVAR